MHYFNRLVCKRLHEHTIDLPYSISEFPYSWRGTSRYPRVLKKDGKPFRVSDRLSTDISNYLKVEKWEI